MVKYSFIMPWFGNHVSNIEECIIALLRQRFRDFEIIISGNKVFDDEVQIVHGIKITNIIISDTNRIGILMNAALKIAEGDFIHVWCNDLIVYENYLECLNEYITKYGDDKLYAGHFIDIRGLQRRKDPLDGIYFKTFDLPEGYCCFPKKYCEPWSEEFEGSASHWSQEQAWRVFQNIKFICMNDVEVIHIPHRMRMTNEQMANGSIQSSVMFERMKQEWIIKHGKQPKLGS